MQFTGGLLHVLARPGETGAGDPHALEVEPELGADPHWVCHKAGVKVASVGSLGSATWGGPSS